MFFGTRYLGGATHVARMSYEVWVPETGGAINRSNAHSAAGGNSGPGEADNTGAGAGDTTAQGASSATTQGRSTFEPSEAGQSGGQAIVEKRSATPDGNRGYPWVCDEAKGGGSKVFCNIPQTCRRRVLVRP